MKIIKIIFQVKIIMMYYIVIKRMVQKKASLDGDDIILMIECDESVIDMDKLINMNRQNKQAMLEAMHSDEQGRAFFNAVKGLNCNIIYRYYGNNSNKKTDIKFLKNELK